MNQSRIGQEEVVSGQWSAVSGQRWRNPASLATSHWPLATGRRGYTLIEILVATALTLLVLGAVVQVFGTVSESISDARSFVEKVDQLRITQRQLKQDLEGETAPTTPPLAPELGLGYFEYVEGPLGPVLDLATNPQAFNSDHNNEWDSTVGDIDDVLMFTTRSRTLPFVGRIGGVASTSQLAEVAWFVRGRTLYRRVLLIGPQTNLSGVGSAGFYNYYDLSARYDPVQKQMVANTLADLTRPENRFAHTNGFNPGSGTPYLYPPHPHNVSPWLAGLKLPTLCESTSSTWDPSIGISNLVPAPGVTLSAAAPPAVPNKVFDAWRNPYVFNELFDPTNDPAGIMAGNLKTYRNATRVSEDVILTNVIGFNVKAWDPGAPIITNSSQTAVLLPGDPGYVAAMSGASPNVVGVGAYVDLNYLSQCPAAVRNAYATSSPFSGPGNPSCPLQGTPGGSTTPSLCSVYDTWCTRFENYCYGSPLVNPVSATTSNPVIDKSYNGFDNDSDGVVNDATEKVIFPPYATPLRGIQVKIRVYEPDSRQVREVTVTQSFVNE